MTPKAKRKLERMEKRLADPEFYENPSYVSQQKRLAGVAVKDFRFKKARALENEI